MTLAATETTETVADLVDRLGEIPLDRIRLQPAPGQATEEDLVSVGRPLCELVEGTLVNKTMGYYESRLAMTLVGFLEIFLRDHDLGYVVGPDALTRLQPDLVRAPDVSFIRWDRLPDRKVPREAIASLAPDLAVEILSPGNTPREMQRKRQEYFDAGVQVVWLVDPAARTVAVSTSAAAAAVFGEDETLQCPEILPGFSLSVREWFQRAG